ncbi:facilitator of iron transport 3 precursor [Aspergillus bombycis]|uniref:Facilitator of iron transport 3 n=1 Tax=Aspergillus bombycis TaxID=109264 RepID=A0A1F8AH71_9EURO|nr:facilitator of iron transport 3 precursor [Aspergillus bombycis]OGM51086.1 facilitator of iron transport 3 precursor [Aspergillus bombycis]
MRIQSLVVLGAVFSGALAHAESAAERAPKWPSTTTTPVVAPTPAILRGHNGRTNQPYEHGLLLEKRDSTTEDAATTAEDATSTTEEAATTTTTEATTQADTTTAPTTTEATTTTDDATTTTESSTTTSSSTTSSTTSTTSTASTTSSTSQSTSSMSTTTTKSTSTTATKTSSTSTATSTTSAEMREYNRRGHIAAIITFSILGAIFFGYGFLHCYLESRKRRQIAARKAAAEAGSDHPLVALNENAKSQSEVNFDRSSMMFASQSQSRTDLSSMAQQGAAAQGYSYTARPSSLAVSETRHQSPTAGPPSNNPQGNFI